MLDADTIPISSDWISFPIWCLEKYRASSVGLDTGLSSAYAAQGGGSAKWWQPTKGYSIRGGFYDNNWFTVTNNLYRVMRSATAKVVSENIGFTRGHSENNKLGSIKEKIYKFLDSHLGSRLITKDPRYPYLPIGCDNGVAANHFLDINRMGGKFNLPLTSYIGLTDQDGAFGQNISDLLFHFALSTRALSRLRREVSKVGKGYLKWIDQIQKAGSIKLPLENAMIKASRKFKPGGYDNSIPTSWYTTEYKFIKTLLKEFHKSSKL